MPKPFDIFEVRFPSPKKLFVDACFDVPDILPITSGANFRGKYISQIGGERSPLTVGFSNMKDRYTVRAKQRQQNLLNIL